MCSGKMQLKGGIQIGPGGATERDLFMRRVILAALAAIVSLCTTAEAADRTRLGFGLLLNNDFLGDGDDRWRSGSIATSRIWGPTWTGVAPERFGDLLELRIQGEVITPSDLRSPDPADRLYAGALSLGLHTHMQRGAAEYAFGGDLVFVGPQTQLDNFQDGLHDFLGISRPSDAVLDAQIDNSINPTLVFESGRRIALSDRSSLRPFVEARAGVETLARVGFDWTFGELGQSELLIRDPITGHRYRGVTSDWSGFSFVVGADVAYVEDSEFFPEDRGPVLDNSRERLRAGVMWQGKNGASGFGGLTYLGEEFEGQEEGQLIGSLRVRFGF